MGTGPGLAACFSSQAAADDTHGLAGCSAVVAAANTDGSLGPVPPQPRLPTGGSNPEAA